MKVVIDIHRDGVGEDTRLVTDVHGEDTAQIMFLNGLCRTSANGPIEYLQNPYLSENLAFSFQLQAKAAQYYPDFTRRIYLRSYQYNLLSFRGVFWWSAALRQIRWRKPEMPYRPLRICSIWFLSGN